MNNPQVLTKNEWEKLMQLPLVIKTWDLDETDTVESFASRVFAVKFNYSNVPSVKLGAFYLISDGTFYGTLQMIHRYADDSLFVLE